MNHLVHSAVRAAVIGSMMCCVPLAFSQSQPDSAADKALLEAIAAGNVSEVSRQLESGMSVNATLRTGLTPMHYAAATGQKAVAEILIARDADINIKARDGNTPLNLATHWGRAEVAGLLIDKGADVNTRALDGATPLFNVSVRGRADVAERLIAKGADVNLTAKDGATPLHAAAAFGHKALAELLIASGANINARDEWTMKGVGWACLASAVDCRSAGWLRGGFTPLHGAAMNGRREVVELLIAKGAEINAKAKDGDTPLHDASYEGKVGVAELLIARGADVNAADKSGDTPLVYATFTSSSRKVTPEHRMVAELLRKSGGK